MKERIRGKGKKLNRKEKRQERKGNFEEIQKKGVLTVCRQEKRWKDEENK